MPSPFILWYGTLIDYAKFNVNIIFLQYLFMNFQCQNTCSGRIQSIKVGALDATANSLWITVFYVYLIKLVADKLLENG